MAQHLNDQLAKRLGCPDGKHHVIHWDEKLKGFGLRVTTKGGRAWIVDYRCNGRQRRLTIGKIDRWNCTAARDEARKILRDASRGIDRMEKPSGDTVRDLWRRYEREKLPQMAQRGQTDVRTMWKMDILPHIGSKKLADVKRQDIERIHSKVTESGRKVRANRILSNIHRVFNLAIDWELIERNPAARISRNRETPRDRFLSPDEFERLFRVLDGCPEQTCADAIKIIMLTGSRKGEVLQMCWDQLDLDNGVWLKPASMTKQRRIHRVVLNEPAIALLKRRRERSTSKYVFPSHATGRALTKVTETWKRARRETGLEGTRLHDLRHTFASLLASGGESLKVIGDLLGHSNPATTARYAHLLDSAQRTATEKVGAIINGDKE